MINGWNTRHEFPTRRFWDAMDSKLFYTLYNIDIVFGSVSFFSISVLFLNWIVFVWIKAQPTKSTIDIKLLYEQSFNEFICTHT